LTNKSATPLQQHSVSDLHCTPGAVDYTSYL